MSAQRISNIDINDLQNYIDFSGRTNIEFKDKNESFTISPGEVESAGQPLNINQFTILENDVDTYKDIAEFAKSNGVSMIFSGSSKTDNRMTTISVSKDINQDGQIDPNTESATVNHSSGITTENFIRDVNELGFAQRANFQQVLNTPGKKRSNSQSIHLLVDSQTSNRLEIWDDVMKDLYNNGMQVVEVDNRKWEILVTDRLSGEAGPGPQGEPKYSLPLYELPIDRSGNNWVTPLVTTIYKEEGSEKITFNALYVDESGNEKRTKFSFTAQELKDTLKFGTGMGEFFNQLVLQ